MKLKYNLEFVELGDEIVAVPADSNSDEFHGVIKVNETAKTILELLADDTTVENIIKTLSAENPNTPENEVKTAVEEYIAELNQYELIED